MKNLLKIKLICIFICLQAFSLSLFASNGLCLSAAQITRGVFDTGTLAPQLNIETGLFQPTYEKAVENKERIDLTPGVLNGVVIVRFAPSYDNTTGGVEKYIQNLNETLIKRNKMTIIQLYISEELESITEIKIGKGRLIKIPILSQKDSTLTRTEGSVLISKIVLVLEKLRIRSLVQNIMLSPGVSRVVKNIPVLRTGYRLVAATSNADRTKEMIEKILEQYKVDLLMLHSRGKPDELVLTEVARKKDIPVIFQNHFSNTILNDFAIKRLLSKVTHVAGVSSLNVPKNLRKNFTVLGDGIDLDFFSLQKAKKNDVDFAAPVILLPARLFPGKGHKDCIKMLRILHERGVKLKIVFAGDESYPGFKEELIQLAGKELANDVIFVGELSHEKLRDHYAASDIVILPSKSEGVPRVLIEAEAMGRPVVAYNVGGIPETMIDGTTGYLVEKGNIREFTDRLQELCSDPQKRSIMGEKGSLFVRERFGLSALAARHETLYVKILNITPHSSPEEKSADAENDSNDGSFPSPMDIFYSPSISPLTHGDAYVNVLEFIQNAI